MRRLELQRAYCGSAAPARRRRMPSLRRGGRSHSRSVRIRGPLPAGAPSSCGARCRTGSYDELRPWQLWAASAPPDGAIVRTDPTDVGCRTMETKVQSLVAEIEALSEAERQTLAQEILPLLLSTRAGLAEIDRSLEVLSDAELDTVIERARQRAGTLGDEAVTAIIDEAIRAAHAHGRS